MTLPNTLARVALLLGLCLLTSGCGSATPGRTAASVTVVDGEGLPVTIIAPAKRVVAINSGMTALVYALGSGEVLVGRDAYSTFPTAALDVPVVAESSAECNLELILSLEPDLVLADGQIHEAERARLAAAQIPVYVDATSDPTRVPTLIRNLGLALGQAERAEELAMLIEERVGSIEARLASRADAARPKVFFEWGAPFKTTSAATGFHQPLVQAGGLNIAAEQAVRLPVMSAEWIISQNPAVIVRRISGDATAEEMQQTRDEIMQRPGWEQIEAVKTGRVYVIKADVLMTFRYPVGLAYYAKWFHPELFDDLDPNELHRELVTAFLGEAEWQALARSETFVYPQ